MLKKFQAIRDITTFGKGSDGMPFPFTPIIARVLLC